MTPCVFVYGYQHFKRTEAAGSFEMLVLFIKLNAVQSYFYNNASGIELLINQNRPNNKDKRMKLPHV
jgi:hypothetical protein